MITFISVIVENMIKFNEVNPLEIDDLTKKDYALL